MRAVYIDLIKLLGKQLTKKLFNNKKIICFNPDKPEEMNFVAALIHLSPHGKIFRYCNKHYPEIERAFLKNPPLISKSLKIMVDSFFEKGRCDKRKKELAHRDHLRNKYPECGAGKASLFIKYFPDIIKDDNSLYYVVLIGRASASDQDKNDNLKGQMINLRNYVKQFPNVVVIDEIAYVGSGWKDRRWPLEKATIIAKKFGSKGIVLTESVDRFLRSPHFHSYKNPNVQPTKEEFKDLAKTLGNVILATMFHPDVTWQETRKEQTKRGMQTKGKIGGRPYKKNAGYMKRMKKNNIARIIRLKNNGTSVSRISDITGISKNKIFRWLKEKKF